MALDIVLYDKNKVSIGLIEILESLHKAIFTGATNWISYSYIKRIKDYYKTNILFNQSELSCFVEVLKHMVFLKG